jgi:prolyl-tRNA synthetase
MTKVPTPGKTTCEDVTALLGVPLTQSVKALALMHEDHMFLLLVRGDHQLNEVKAGKVPGLDPFRFATDAEIVERLRCKPGYIGPVGIPDGITVVADRTVAAMSDFVCGANEAGFHLTGVNFGRDLPEPAIVADIRNVVVGDPSPDGKGTLDLCRGIEVGHVFQLRTKYAEAMGATFLDEAGRRSRWRWAATASASRASWPPPSSRTTTTAGSSFRNRWRRSRWRSSRSATARATPCATPPTNSTPRSTCSASRCCSTTATSVPA